MPKEFVESKPAPPSIQRNPAIALASAPKLPGLICHFQSLQPLSNQNNSSKIRLIWNARTSPPAPSALAGVTLEQFSVRPLLFAFTSKGKGFSLLFLIPSSFCPGLKKMYSNSFATSPSKIEIRNGFVSALFLSIKCRLIHASNHLPRSQSAYAHFQKSLPGAIRSSVVPRNEYPARSRMFGLEFMPVVRSGGSDKGKNKIHPVLMRAC